MKSEKLIKLVTAKDIPSKLTLEALHDDYEGFRLLLRDDRTGKMLRIFFDSYLVYRNTDEGNLLKLWQERIGFSKWPIYYVENSQFIKWFNTQNFGMYENKHMVHYAIITQNDCVDIISFCPPKIEWLDD